MCATAAKTERSILLFDVPWKAYVGLTDALPEHRLPHTYQEGTLELFKTVLYHVPWGAYEKILKAFGDRRFPHTYQEGTLEIMMSPSEDHERIKSFLGRVIENAASQFHIRYKAVGSATRRDKRVLHGLEPDESFYIPYEQPSSDPSGRRTKQQRPDLAIDVDLRRPDLDRMKSYAKLGIREFWQYRHEQVRIYRLSAKGKYEEVEQSQVFPVIGSHDLTRFVGALKSKDDYTVTESFKKWLRKKRPKK